MTDLNQVESEIRDLDVETNEVVEETLEEAKAPVAKGDAKVSQPVDEFQSQSLLSIRQIQEHFKDCPT